MTTKPFLAGYAVEREHQKTATTAEYDPTTMVLLINGRAAVLEPTFGDRGITKETRVERETTDDN